MIRLPRKRSESLPNERFFVLLIEWLGRRAKQRPPLNPASAPTCHIAKCHPGDFNAKWNKSRVEAGNDEFTSEEQQWIHFRNDSMIKLALDTIDPELILRWQVDEARSNKPVDLQQYHRLTRARDLLQPEVATRRWCYIEQINKAVTDNRRHVRPHSGASA